MISPQSIPNPEVDNFTISNEKLESVLAAGALTAIRENQRFGLPFITVRNGQIVQIDPFEAEVELLKIHPELATQ